MGAYDRREQISKRIVTRVNTGATGNRRQTVSQVARSTSKVLSYRSVPTGALVTDQEADPYAYFLAKDSHGRREAAKAARRLGTGEPVVVDNGHAFLLDRHQMVASTKSGRWKESSAPSANDVTGSPVSTCWQNFYTWERDNLLFSYSNTVNDNQARYYTTPFARIPAWDPQYWGTKAITTLAPTRPEVNIFVTLAELLREGIPQGLIANSVDAIVRVNRFKWRDINNVNIRDIATQSLSGVKSGAKGASGDYLNFMFAIKPLFQDIVALQDVCYNALGLIEQYYQDAGKGVRRSMTMKEEKKAKTFDDTHISSLGRPGVDPTNYPVFMNEPVYVPGQHVANFKSVSTHITQTLEESISFSGSFSYYLPVPEGFWGRMESYKALSERLFGSPISLEVFWELTPWSWLIDWFVDLQSVLALADTYRNKDLVINYGYLMRTVTCRTKIVQLFTYDEANNRSVPEVSTEYLSTRKERIRANPFGFGPMTPGSLNATQMSLLAAVGISGGRK